MDTKDEEIIKMARDMSQKLLNKGKGIVPTCLVYKKDGSMEIIEMKFDGYKSKEVLRNMLKQQLVLKEMEKYVMIMDTKMTKMDKNNRYSKVLDVILISIYSPQNKIAVGYPYKADRKLITSGKEVLEMEGREGQDCWDIWGEEVEFDSEVQKQYQEYKKSHQGLYKGLDTKSDEIYDLKTKGKCEDVDLGFGFNLRVYRFENKAILEGINREGKVFFSSNIIDDDKDLKEKLNEVSQTIKMIGDRLSEMEDEE